MKWTGMLSYMFRGVINTGKVDICNQYEFHTQARTAPNMKWFLHFLCRVLEYALRVPPDLGISMKVIRQSYEIQCYTSWNQSTVAEASQENRRSITEYYHHAE